MAPAADAFRGGPKEKDDSVAEVVADNKEGQKSWSNNETDADDGDGQGRDSGEVEEKEVIGGEEDEKADDAKAGNTLDSRGDKFALDCFSSTLFVSPVPSSCLREGGEGVVLGVDEAGRGSVLGPMTYGAAYWAVEDDEELKKAGFDDSKALTPQQRRKLFDRIRKHPKVGWVLRCIGPQELSAKMLRRCPVSLNAISHDACIEMVQAVRLQGVAVAKVFVDTVGNERAYQDRLTKEFGGTINFTVKAKADSLYKSVSAASICAKVLRDDLMEAWKWNEPAFVGSHVYGSGYPSDPQCKAWMAKHFEPVFGYPDVCRFSWSTTREMFKLKRGAEVEWAAEQQGDNNPAAVGCTKMTAFLTQAPAKKRSRYFRRKGLELVEGL